MTISVSLHQDQNPLLEWSNSNFQKKQPMFVSEFLFSNQYNYTSQIAANATRTNALLNKTTEKKKHRRNKYKIFSPKGKIIARTVGVSYHIGIARYQYPQQSNSERHSNLKTHP